MKPSERIQALSYELGDSTKVGAIIAYLDEREASVHPIARAHPAPVVMSITPGAMDAMDAASGEQDRRMAAAYDEAAPPSPTTCLGCGNSFLSPDHDPRCSSCVESGTGPEPAPTTLPSDDNPPLATVPPLPVAHRVTREPDSTTPDACELAFSKVELPVDGREIGPEWWFWMGWEARR